MAKSNGVRKVKKWQAGNIYNFMDNVCKQKIAKQSRLTVWLGIILIVILVCIVRVFMFKYNIGYVENLEVLRYLSLKKWKFEWKGHEFYQNLIL